VLLGVRVAVLEPVTLAVTVTVAVLSGGCNDAWVSTGEDSSGRALRGVGGVMVIKSIAWAVWVVSRALRCLPVRKSPPNITPAARITTRKARKTTVTSSRLPRRVLEDFLRLDRGCAEGSNKGCSP